MQESLRQEILQAMGVRPLLPRYVFSGAKSSTVLSEEASLDELSDEFSVEELSSQTVLQPEASLPVTEKSQTTEDSTADIKPDIISTDADIIDSINAVPENVEVPVQLSAELEYLSAIKEELSLSSKSRKSAKFRYRLIFVGDLLMLVDQPLIEWKLEKQTKQFFTDIHLALTHSLPEYWSENQFDWPPVKYMPVEGDDAIKETLKAYIDAHARQVKLSWILVWGKKLTLNLVDQPLDVGESCQQDDHGVLQLHDLHHYFESPYNKKLLWQHLQVVGKSY